MVEQEEQPQPGTRSSTDALSRLPTSYGDVPGLGPPLPGDLGKPILQRQQALAGEIGTGAEQRVEQVAQAEHECRAAEFKAARESDVLVQTRQTVSSEPVATVGVNGSTAILPEPAKQALDADHDPNAQAHKAEFVAALDPRGDLNPYQLTPLPSPYTLSAGSGIAASLITGLRSDLPGLVTAQVTARVYYSATGSILLIPQGSRLIGSYDSVVAFGQKRALIVWQRLMLPDGSSLRIDNVPATDPSGYARAREGEMTLPADDADRLIKIDEVQCRVGLGKTMIYRLIKNGTFPAPYKLSPFASGGASGRSCNGSPL